MKNKSNKKIYYDGIKRAGMDAWVLKAIYKIGVAGIKGKSVGMSATRVRKYLYDTHLIMRDNQGMFMLTADGQVVFKNIKFK